LSKLYISVCQLGNTKFGHLLRKNVLAQRISLKLKSKIFAQKIKNKSTLSFSRRKERKRDIDTKDVCLDAIKRVFASVIKCLIS